MEVIQDARRRGSLSVRRRHEGTTVPQLVEADMWITLGANLLACSAAPFEDDLKIVFLAVGSIFIWVGVDILSWEPSPLDPINHANKDRGIDSFSDEYCYRELRFTKAQLRAILRELDLPFTITLDNRTRVYTEYAFCLALYRIHYPCTLCGVQETFGRDYSAVSRVNNGFHQLLYDRYSGRCAVSNLDFYRNRLDFYNEAMRGAISNHHANQQPGAVPAPIFDVCGIHDGTKHYICRPYSAPGGPNVQNAFYSGYAHAHIQQWAGTCFPDGMIILDGPFPGHYVDITTWRESGTRRSTSSSDLSG